MNMRSLKIYKGGFYEIAYITSQQFEQDKNLLQILFLRQTLTSLSAVCPHSVSLLSYLYISISNQTIVLLWYMCVEK